jgi:SAM-dependent methyltransferase
LIQDIYKFWNITDAYAVGDTFTGYEDLYDEFDKHTKQSYDKNPSGTIDSVFDLYRSRGIVPIDYYTESGLVNAIREFASAKYNSVQGDVIGLGNNQGQKISRFVFTNMMTAEPKGRGSNSLRDRFNDDAKLKRAIRICFEFRDGNNLVYPTAMRRALELVTGENIQNFKPQNARAIVEHLCPVLFGRIYDYSAGYGGRLLGITASNMHYQYTGIDPNTETVERLNYLNSLIQNSGTIVQSVSEEYEPENIDCAFSSPPYFNLEKYSDEDTQCMVRYTTLDEWFEGYVRPTMERIYRALNTDGVFATNIADYKTAKEEFAVCDRWCYTAQQVGFKNKGTIRMMLNTRPGVGNDKLAGREKYENVYVFAK